MNITGSSKERRLTETQRKILIGIHPFIAIWVVFGFGALLDWGFTWWSIPYAASSIGWIGYSLYSCDEEFNWRAF